MGQDKGCSHRVTSSAMQLYCVNVNCSCIIYHTYCTEIDYTSGDIDATLSIHSWCYEPRDNVKADSVLSLPIFPRGAI